MVTKNIPTTIDDISPEWLTEALTRSGVLKNNTVRALNHTIIGEGQGYVGTLARVSIEYDQPDDTLPANIIAKVPTQVPKSKLIMEAFWNYERENRLYDEILPELPVRTPQCYFSDFDIGKGKKWMDKVYGRYGSLPQGLTGLYFMYAGLRNLMQKRRYILLLEDISDLEQLSHLDGCTFEDARLVMKPLGLAHAHLWESPQLENFWLRDHAKMSNMMSFIANRWQPIVKKSFPGKISPKMQAVFDWMKTNNQQLDEYSKTRPHTLVHSDFRIDNLFFDRATNEVTIIDWQASFPGMGLFDTAFFLLNNCNTPLEPEQVEELITLYHQSLVEGGVSNYSLDSCMSDYPIGLLLALRYWLIIIGGIEVEKDPNAIQLFNVLLDRMRPMVEAIDLSQLPI